MAAFYKLPSGLWRAQINRRGMRKSRAFPLKSAAVAWASKIEGDILTGQIDRTPSDKTFGDLLERYMREVSAHKKGKRWEEVRIGLIRRDSVAQVRLRDFNVTHISQWRDRRLQAVSAASVRREWNLLAHACSIAVKEWKWLRSNPFAGVRRPKDGKARQELVTEADLEKMAEFASTDLHQTVLRAARFAIETGMRAGEICALKRVEGRVAYIEDSKNADRREVPLSSRALDLWRGPFDLRPSQIDTVWRKLTEQAGLGHLHFHDTRRTAITRLSKKLHPLQLARMVGHRDLKMLMVYYRESAEDVADKLG